MSALTDAELAEIEKRAEGEWFTCEVRDAGFNRADLEHQVDCDDDVCVCQKWVKGTRYLAVKLAALKRRYVLRDSQKQECDCVRGL